MVLMLELLLFIFGLVLVACGKLPVSSKRAVEGVPARMLGVLAMLPLVLMFGIGLVQQEPAAETRRPALSGNIHVVLAGIIPSFAR